MWPSVEAKFVEFSAPLEGVVTNPYLDVKGLVTVGIGCLIDPVETSEALPWVDLHGNIAQPATVLANLRALKAQQGLKAYPAKSAVVQAATKIRLTEKGVADLADARLRAAEAYLRKCFAAWDTWPADAQLCALSMAWAVGAGWPPIFGNSTRSLSASPPRFLEAIIHAPDPQHPGLFLPAEIDISTKGNPGIVPRNAQNELCLSNAQLVQDRGLDPSVLYWPSTPLLAQPVA